MSRAVSEDTTVARRSVLIGLAAIPAVGVTSEAFGASDLPALIQAHESAYQAFVRAMDDLNESEEKNRNLGDGVIVPSLLGGGMSLRNGYDECRKHIAGGYEAQRERLKPLSRVAPELAEQVRAVMDAKQAENMDIIDKFFAEEEARKEACGLAAAERNYQAASDAETDAALAICAYRCRTLEEARIKAEYLAEQEMLRDGLQEDQVEALLASFYA